MKIGLDKSILYSFAIHTQYLLDYVRIALLRLCGIIHTEKAPSCCEPGAYERGAHTMLDTGYGFIGEDGVERVSPEEVWEAEAEDEG